MIIITYCNDNDNRYHYYNRTVMALVPDNYSMISMNIE